MLKNEFNEFKINIKNDINDINFNINLQTDTLTNMIQKYANKIETIENEIVKINILEKNVQLSQKRIDYINNNISK